MLIMVRSFRALRMLRKFQELSLSFSEQMQIRIALHVTMEESHKSVVEDVCPLDIDYGALPEAVVLMLFSQLPLKDMLHAGSTCQHWNRCLSAVWRPRCLSRWRHWSTPPPARDADAAQWRALYARRHQVDKNILQLLATDVTWPSRKADAFATIMAHGADGLDVLAAAAKASTHSGLYIGISHHAHTALQLVQGQLAADRIGQLLAAEAGSIRRADSTVELDTGGSPSAGLSKQLQRSATLTAHGGEDYVLEVALQLAQTLHPLSDIGAVRRIIEQLGDELGKRMTAAGATPGSRQALHLLNALLFSKPSSSTATSARGEEVAGVQQEVSTGTHSIGSSQDSPSSSDSSSGAGGCWSSVWPQDVDLCGPDLTGFVVPTDGQCGLGFKGTQQAYGHASSSSMDSVVAQRTGLPITLAVLHRAVGRRAGLDIQLVNMPGHVVNRVVLSSRDSSSRARSNDSSGGASGSSASGTEADAVAVYIDAFAGREMVDQQLGQIWMQFSGSSLPAEPQQRQVLQDMSAQAVCARMLANLCSLATRNLFQPGGVLAIHSNLRLTAALIQLLPRYCKDVLPPVVEMLLEQEQRCRSNFVRLYADLLTKGGFEPDPAMLATYTGPLPESLEAPLAHSNPQCAPQPFRVGMCLPLGQGAARDLDLDRATAFVAWRANVNGRGVTVADVVLGKHGGSLAHAGLGLPPNAPPLIDPTPAWAATNCCDVIKQAHQLLADAWHEDDFEARLGVLLQSSGQQLQAPNSWGWELAAMKLCSQALGRAFDAVWYDASMRQCVLVPNSFMRHKFPQG